MNQCATILTPAWVMAQTPGQPQPPMWVSFMPFIILLVMFYFLLIRPQQKKMKAHQEMVNAIKTGDKVVAAGGIHGVVANVKDSVITLRIAEQVKIDVDKHSVSLVNPESK